MKALELKIPPVLLLLIFGVLMWLIDDLLPQYSQHWPWHQWAAWSLFLLGVFLIVAGFISFRRAHTTVDPTRPEKASLVVKTGIYRMSRNPMYLGFLMMLLAFMFKLSNPVTLLALPLFVLYMNQFQIKPEEKALQKRFGNDYIEFYNNVRRWI